MFSLTREISKNSIIDLVLLGRREFAVAFDDFLNGINQVLLRDALPPGADREHSSLSAHAPDLCPRRIRAQPPEQFKPDVLVHVHCLAVDFEDVTHFVCVAAQTPMFPLSLHWMLHLHIRLVYIVDFILLP